VRVYAGKSGDVQHGHGSDWPMWLLDISLDGGHMQEVLASHRGFVYMLDGAGRVGGKAVKKGDVAWFEPGGGQLALEGGLRALLFSGEPIDEPVVAYGPFVMNTREEIVKAFEDYQAGRLVA
jgi:quercetin 2,3-dioxygenase